uniref:DNA replication factor Cdt1 n=1 Tax=Lygus hesperus TaxID=30085 RepID=A0A0A9XMN1_LYGHE
MSPTKPSTGAPAYVSPRKLFDTPPQTSPSKPAYQRFYDLAVAGKPALPLPYKFRCLAETFRSVDTVVSMMYNRNENVVFNKLRASVQQLSKRNLNESHIGQIMSVLPAAFELKREKVRSFGSQKEQYELVLKPVIPEGEATSNGGDNVKVSMSPSILLQRRRDFYNALLEKAKDHHELFLSSLDPPLVIPKDKLMRWHPDFDVDSCADVLPASLPSAPVQEKLSTAKDVLIKAKDMLSSNNRMEKALERLSGTQPPLPTSETAAATAALAKALKGIPKSLLEKVRAKQAAKTAALLTRCPEETKRRLELTRLPELSRILRNIFVLERKNVIPLPVVLEKIAQSYREVLSQDDTMRHIQLIKESVPGWITEIMDGEKKYIRLARDADFARITKRLQQLITDNKVNL